MRFRNLGAAGVRVSELCLGAMMFGAWGNPDHDDCIRIIHAALDAGVNFIDTADVYSAGESEEIVGKALAGGRRENVVLATAEGYAFPTNLDSDQPIGSLVPPSQVDTVLEALSRDLTAHDLDIALREQNERRTP